MAATYTFFIHPPSDRMSSTLTDTAIEIEARRRVAEEQAVARKLALEKQRQRDLEKMRLIEAQREDRVRREAEQIQARLRAEEAEREARARADQEAFEAAVAAQVEALRKRPLEEKLRAEIEELREVVGTLTGDLRGVLSVPPPSYGLGAIQSQVATLSSCPWNSGISEIKSQLASGVAALQAQVAELRTLSTRPARSVMVHACPAVLGGITSLPQAGGALSSQLQNPSGVRTLEIQYHLTSQTSPAAAAGAVYYLDLQENSGGVIAVPAGHKIFVARAQWKPHNNVRSGAVILDVTSHVRALGIEHQ